jgi:signal peptidase
MKKKPKAKNVIINIFLALAILLVVISTASIFLADRENAFLLGYKPFVVGSESMAPEVQKYGVAIIKKTDMDEVEEGDNIAFRAVRMGGAPVFHRVIEITPEGFVTKGDANKIADDQIVDEEAFIGKEVWHTNVTATLLPLLKTPKGILMVIVLPIALIVLIVILVKVLKRGIRDNG